MRRYTCSRCDNTVYFENTTCLACQATLAFDPARLAMVAAEPGGGWPWTSGRACGHREGVVGCNWLVPAHEPRALCLSCRMTRTTPDLADGRAMALWADFERAKRRLAYSLLRLGLLRADGSTPAPQFDFLAPNPAQPTVLTGHANGVITLNLEEADSAHREQVRQEMGEPYRTPLGHLRHESGHFYWDRFFASSADAARNDFRRIFGDERADYAAALRCNYEQGAPVGWEEQHISAYAASHPWEDWAETWAHYLHIIDVYETATAFGLQVPARPFSPATDMRCLDPYAHGTLAEIMERWLPISLALNSLNRSLGQPDAYPFVLSPTVTAKLEAVHRFVRANGQPAGQSVCK